MIHKFITFELFDLLLSLIGVLFNDPDFNRDLFYFFKVMNDVSHDRSEIYVLSKIS